MKRPVRSKKSSRRSSPWRRRLGAVAALALLGHLALSAAGNWFVHHPPSWLAERERAWPAFAYRTLLHFGDRAAYLTDNLGWTGHDTIYDFDEPAPEGRVLFAGEPRRRAAPAPADVQTLDRGEFLVGWSPSLHRPAWVAYHVPAEARFEATERPGFHRDKAAKGSPPANAYERSGYDRGHMAPNYAIVTRFGPEEQKKTFLMSNVAPQSPSLNRGPWRRLEHLIADLWTARYGEIWVVVGAVPQPGSRETISGSGVDVPDKLFMLMAAQEGESVRTLALVFSQNVDYDAYSRHNIVTLEELERLTGYDFFPELPEFIRGPLLCDRPSRLWPVGLGGLIGALRLRFE